MKIDLYTKAVLTVIACCLLYIAAKDVPLVQEVRAQSGEIVNVNIVQVAGRTINARDMGHDAFLPVKVK